MSAYFDTVGSPGMSSIGSQDTSSTRRSRRLLSLAEEEEEENTQPSSSPPGKRQKTSTSLFVYMFAHIFGGDSVGGVEVFDLDYFVGWFRFFLIALPSSSSTFFFSEFLQNKRCSAVNFFIFC